MLADTGETRPAAGAPGGAGVNATQVERHQTHLLPVPRLLLALRHAAHNLHAERRGRVQSVRAAREIICSTQQKSAARASANLEFLVSFRRNQTACNLPGAESVQSDAGNVTKYFILLLAGIGIVQEVGDHIS